jgi:hypothetical protein
MYYRAYQDGFLPYGTALAHQPNVLVEALMEVSAAKSALDAEDAEKAENGNDNVTAEGDGFKSVLKHKG